MIFNTGNKNGINLGMFGYTPAGEALYEFLAQRPFLDARVEKICAYAYEVKGTVPAGLYTTDPHVLLYSKNINIIIEFLNDPVAAYNIVKASLELGKKVIASNKIMINSYKYELSILDHTYPGKLLIDPNFTDTGHIIKSERNDDDLYNSIIEEIIRESKHQLSFF